ncbi:MAG: 4Fe-4S ferredoxin [Dehalococcoidia bacterium]|nr:4Fe-4S ferredoxin [Dehalococcoidia bacterium]
MLISRRQFLKLASLSTIGAVACNFFDEEEFIAQSPVRLPEDLVTGIDNWYATNGNGPETEGLLVRVIEGRAKKVQGNPLFPTNKGVSSIRSEALLQELYHPDRLSGPMVRTGPRGSKESFVSSGDWDKSLEILYKKLYSLVDHDQMLMITGAKRGSLAFLIQEFTNTYGGNHAVCKSVDELVYENTIKKVFQQEKFPHFDIAKSDFILSIGGDFLGTWLSPIKHGRGWGEFRQGEGRSRGTLIHVDSRFSLTAANADEWLPITPGQEGKLALSIAFVLLDEGLIDKTIADDLTEGQGSRALIDFAPDTIGDQLGIPHVRHRSTPDIIRETARAFAKHGQKSLAIGGGNAAAHTNGSFNMNAIYLLNHLVGSVNTEGGIIFNPSAPIPELNVSLKPNSMIEMESITKKITDGGVKLLLIHGSNPVYSMPADLRFKEAINRDDIFVVSFSSFLDETSQMADLILPDRVTLESWSNDIPDPGPGFQVVSMGQPVVNPLPGINPMAFGDILVRMGHELGMTDNPTFNNASYYDLLRNHANRLFSLQRGSITKPNFDAFWNTLLQRGVWWDLESIGDNQTLEIPSLIDTIKQKSEPAITGPSGSTHNIFYLVPFEHISLTDGTNAHMPWLQSTPDPITSVAWTSWIEMNTDTAKGLAIKEGDIVNIEGANGETISAQVYHHPAVPPTVVSMPFGQGRKSGDVYSKDRGPNPMEILGMPHDKHTGSLAWASTTVRITKTQERTPIPKFEGIVPAYATSEEEAIAKVTNES